MAKQILWDWNGTLLDDAEISLRVLNRMLTDRGLAPVDMERYRDIFTFPIRDYYRLAGFDFDREPYEHIAEDYIAAYPIAAKSASLMPGALDALCRFRDAGFRQTIISAGETGLLRRQTDALGVTDFFDGIHGADDGYGGGKAEIAARWLAESGSCDASYFIGDTLHDREIAVSIGCTPILVTFGHQSRRRLSAFGDAVIDRMEELYPIIFGTAQAL